MISNINNYISDLDELKTIITNNPGLILINFKAKWCNPCNTVSPLINNYLYNNFNKDNVKIYIIDIDESIELYIKLKKLKILSGIPSLICYKNKVNDFNNISFFFPDDSTFGSNQNNIIEFFNRCEKFIYNL